MPVRRSGRWSTGTSTSRCGDRALIVVQDRDWESLPVEAREQVRALQRSYVDLWAAELRRLVPDLSLGAARARAHAVFGLINSTPHSGRLPDEEMRRMLTEMALRALDSPAVGWRMRGRQRWVLVLAALVGIAGGVTTAIVAPGSSDPGSVPAEVNDPLRLGIPQVSLPSCTDEAVLVLGVG